MIEINFTALIFALSFIVFLGLMNIVFFKPVKNTIQSREGSVDGDKSSFEDLISTITAKTQQITDDPAIKAKKLEAAEIVNMAKAEALEAKQKFLDETTTELKAKRERNVAALEEESATIFKNLEGPIKEITTLMVGKLVNEKNLDIEINERQLQV